MVKAAWVYLTQNTRSDESYSVDRRGPLERSLELLQAHSLDKHPRPVIIFHEGDFKPDDQAFFTKQWPLVQFREIRFTMPDFLSRDDIPEKWGGKFSIGYRHMIRFYSLLIYPLLWDEFDYYARMDDDSFLLSPVRYDLFDHMAANNLDYTYRVDCQDGYSVCRGFSELVRSYLLASEVKPGTLWSRNIEPTNSPTFHARPQDAWPPPPKATSGKRRILPAGRRRMIAGRRRVAEGPVQFEWNRWGYYNNFHGTRLSFWRRPDVQDFLRFLDRTGGGYKYRWNDLIVQSAAVQIFSHPDRVAKLTDWDYEHRTNTPDGKLAWGGRYCRDLQQTVRCANTR
jgi:alpha 1,2-mannosyltransferase